MAQGFLDHMRIVPDHRIPGMVTYPLDEIFLTTLVGVVCGGDDWEGIEEVAPRRARLVAPVPSLQRGRRYRADFAKGVSPARSCGAGAGFFRLGVVAATASARGRRRGRQNPARLAGRPTEPARCIWSRPTPPPAGLVLAQRAVDGKSNEITAIPELLDMLAHRRRDRLDRRDGDAKGDRRPHRREKSRLPCSPSKAIKPISSQDAKLFLHRSRLRAPVCAPRPRDRRRPWPHRRADLLRRRRRLVVRAPSRMERLAVARRHHRAAHRQENRGAKRGDTVLHLLAQPRPTGHLAGDARPLGRRERPGLDVGRDLRRRSLPHAQGQLPTQPRHHPSRRRQHPQNRPQQRLSAPKAPPSLRRPPLPIPALRRLTI